MYHDSLISCLFSNPNHLELLIFLSCLFGTVGSAVVPWCGELWMLALMLHIEGWGQAFINTGMYGKILLAMGHKLFH